MAINIKDILNAGVAAQAASLAVSNIPSKRKKKSIIKTGVNNIVGISLLKAQGDIINGM